MRPFTRRANSASGIFKWCKETGTHPHYCQCLRLQDLVMTGAVFVYLTSVFDFFFISHPLSLSLLV